MLILLRPPHDLFTFRLFFNLTKQIKIPADTFYLWSAAIDPSNEFGITLKDNRIQHQNELMYRDELFQNIKNNLIVLGIKDHLTSKPFNPTHVAQPDLVEYLNDLVKFYKDKKFVIFTSLENLDLYVKEDNVFIIPWGGDITNQSAAYPLVEPVLEKNLASNTTFLSLNRNKRTNRALALSTVFGLNLENFGIMSCMFDDYDIDLPVDEVTRKILDVGIEKAKNFTYPIQDSRDIYPRKDNDNVFNFQHKLKSYYKETFVEIIAETSFTEQAFLITEKTLNSVYGCSFPIWLTSSGAVKFLRNIGLDVFDDIIDHRYDLIEDPVERGVRAILDNKNLLENPEKTKDLWISCQERFLKNIQFVRKDMYKFYQTRAELLFKEWLNTCSPEIS